MAKPSDEQLDEIAARFWRESRYSGWDGRDFDYLAFARECERMTREALDDVPELVAPSSAEAMRMALAALEKSLDNFPANVQHRAAIVALRRALSLDVKALRA